MAIASVASKRVRNLQPGDRFILKRTREVFTFVRREPCTPSGTRHVVLRDGQQGESSLHHSCHVIRIPL
jgi:hypothetical protein